VTKVKAVVVSPDGEYASMDDGYQTAMPAGWLSFGDELLDVHARMAARESVLIIPHAWRDPIASERLRLAGWAHKPPRDDERTENNWGGWTTFTKGQQSVHVGILSIMDPARTPLFALDATPHMISRRLVDMHRLIGSPFRKSPGTVGAAMIRDAYERFGEGWRQPRWFLNDLPEGVRGIGDLVWRRPRHGRECQAPYIHGYDVHGAYLSAATMAELAWGTLAHVTGPRFDPSIAGFWQVQGDSIRTPRWPGDPAGVWAPPLIHAARFDENNRAWMTTPMVRWLIECGARPLVRQGYIADRIPNGPATRRLLRTWGESIRNARNDAAHFPNEGDRHAFRETLKRIPNETVGLFKPTSRRGRINRADWAWTIRDVNRVNLLRKIRDIYTRTGRWPIRVKTDAVYYALEVEDPGVAAKTQLDIDLAASWSPGRWHWISTDAAGDWTDPEPKTRIEVKDDVPA
jgi:hypothetical protein